MNQPVLPGAAESVNEMSQSPLSADLPKAAVNRTCTYCRSEIEEGAKFCSKCRMYQSRWKNEIVYIGGLIGPIAILVSAIVYVLTASFNYSDSQQKDAVTAIYLRYPGFQLGSEDGDILLSNHGGGDVYVSDIVFEWGGGQSNYSVSVDRDIKRNTTLDVPLKIIYNEAFPKDDNPNDGVIISNKTGVPPERVLIEASKKAANRCVSPRFITKSDPQYKRISKAFAVSGDSPVAIRVDAHLNTISDRTGLQLSVSLPDVVVMFGTRGEPWCHDSDWVE